MTDDILGGGPSEDMPEPNPENSSSSDKQPSERQPEPSAEVAETPSTEMPLQVSSWAPYPFPYEPKKKPEKEEFRADGGDMAFALFAFVIGYLFVRWLLFSWRGWGTALFTVVYCGGAAIYLLKKGVKIPREGWFWLAVTVLTGLTYALWTGNGLEPYRGLFLFCTAVYSVIAAAGVQILGKTGNWLFLDGINAVFVIPFRNFGAQYKCLAGFRKNKEKGKTFLSIALGAVLALIVVGYVTPLLLEADSGGFSKIVGGVQAFFDKFLDWVTVIELILAIPVAAYIFGLVFGCANRRKCGAFSKDKTEGLIADFRILPPATVYTLLGTVSAFYLLFIGTQLPYFFSAFSGVRPEGWEVYSEYARRGFFELCGIAAINLSLVTAANVLCRTPRTASKPLKVFNAVLMLLTMLLIGTALSKMALYVSAYGLSMRRLLPCVFMVFLFIVCGGVIILQKRGFSILRFAAVVGSVIFCLLCLSDPDGFVVRYNADRYLNGTLQKFDVEILYQSGPAGVDAALDVYQQTADPALKNSLQCYMREESDNAAYYAGRASDSLQRMRARNNKSY